MVDGAAILTTMFHAFRAMGIWEDERGTNMLDTGAHFYDVYETADGKYVSIGSIEPQFYAELLRLTGLEGEELPWQQDKAAVAGDEGAARRGLRAPRRATSGAQLMEGTDVCFAPVLSLGEAPAAPAQRPPRHLRRARRRRAAGPGAAVQPARRCRSSGRRRTRASTPTRSSPTWGFDADRVAKLRDAGAIA